MDSKLVLQLSNITSALDVVQRVSELRRCSQEVVQCTFWTFFLAFAFNRRAPEVEQRASAFRTHAPEVEQRVSELRRRSQEVLQRTFWTSLFMFASSRRAPEVVQRASAFRTRALDVVQRIISSWSRHDLDQILSLYNIRFSLQTANR